jgi:hypothetical protein
MRISIPMVPWIALELLKLSPPKIRWHAGLLSDRSEIFVIQDSSAINLGHDGEGSRSNNCQTRSGRGRESGLRAVRSSEPTPTKATTACRGAARDKL